MAAHAQLDAAGSSRAGALRIRTAILSVLLALPFAAHAQNTCSNAAELQKLSDEGHWKLVLQATSHCPTGLADVDYYRGLAFAGLDRWAEAKAAFESGEQSYPHVKRSPVDLADVAFKQTRFQAAHRLLRRAQRIALDQHIARDGVGARRRA